MLFAGNLGSNRNSTLDEYISYPWGYVQALMTSKGVGVVKTWGGEPRGKGQNFQHVAPKLLAKGFFHGTNFQI